jgi:cytochrome P450
MTLTPPTAGMAADPYPYYADLRALGPLFRDDESGLLIATTAGAVREVLASGAQTRPSDAPVPPAIVDTPAGRIFGRLIRMTDGLVQREVKAAVATALGRVTDEALGAEARQEAARLLAAGGIGPTALGFQVPVRVMAGALGFGGDSRGELRDLIADFVQCISPLSGPDAIEAAIAAAAELESRVAGLLGDGKTGLACYLRAALERPQAAYSGHVLANAVGLLSQTYDATGALVGVALVTMARYPDSLDAFRAAPVEYLREVARFDAPIQNTRRFFHGPDRLLGTDVKAGDAVLLLLASANRDPEVNPDPDVFDPARANLMSYTFSMGTHRCPGEEIALHLAAGTLRALLDSGFSPVSIDLAGLRYQTSANARIPMLA